MEPNSPAQLAEAIARLYQTPGLARDLGRAARENVSTKFDSERCIDRCEQLLKPYFQGLS